MVQTLAVLQSQVQMAPTMEEGVTVLLNGIAKRMLEAAADPAEVARLASDLRAAAISLVGAVRLGTPEGKEEPQVPIATEPPQEPPAHEIIAEPETVTPTAQEPQAETTDTVTDSGDTHPKKTTRHRVGK